MRRFRYVVADVFTDSALAGNQLAVFTDARDLDSITMQALAKEMNFSETVFVLPPSTTDADVRIRIFTPAIEMQFAGHPTLGTAFVLGGPLQKIVLRIETAPGVVPVELEREGAKIVFGWMEQPIPTWEPVERTAELFALLGVAGSGLPVEVYDNGMKHLYVELGSAEEVAAVAPDTRALGRLTDAGVTASPVRTSAGRRAHSSERSASRKTRRPGPRPARSRCISRDTGASGSGRRSRSRRVSSWAVRRSCTHAPTARRIGSSASSSVAPP